MFGQLLCALGYDELYASELARSVRDYALAEDKSSISKAKFERTKLEKLSGLTGDYLPLFGRAAYVSAGGIGNFWEEIRPATRKVVLNEHVARTETFSEELHSTKFRVVAILALQSFYFLHRIAKWKLDYAKTQSFDRTKSLPYFTSVHIEDAQETLNGIIDETFDSTEDQTKAKQILQVIFPPGRDAGDILKALEQAFAMHQGLLHEMGAARFMTLDDDKKGHTNLADDDQEKLQLYTERKKFTIAWPASWGEGFVTTVMNLAQRLREADREPRFKAFLAFHVAYEKITTSHRFNEPLLSATRFLGTVGFRPHSQTYLSLTDPGEGHIFGTTRHSRWMTGVIVHNEYLERPKEASKEAPSQTDRGTAESEGEPVTLSRAEMEAYRIPDIVDFTCVRLHVGAQAPTTAYIGRFARTSPSGDFNHDFTQATKTVKAALAAFFSRGAAECKISMDGLKTSEMLKYMKALHPVIREPLQYLSAAFNINPADGSVTDDTVDPPRKLTTPMDICSRGIELAAEAGFDKVTFDGASDRYPSEPFIKQIKFPDALRLVHEAHSVGLTTYMSAGFTFKNIKDAVYTGVDGIGLGGAQILRIMDPVTGMHGPYTEENIDRIKVEREDAEKSLRGRGALLLARLDQMYFEGSCTEEEEELRGPLYDALRIVNIREIRRILSQTSTAGCVMGIVDDGEQPYIGRARRILRSDEPLLKKGDKGDGTKWEEFKKLLKKCVDAKNEEDLLRNENALRCEYQDSPWIEFRATYREAEATRKGVKIIPHYPDDPRDPIKA